MRARLEKALRLWRMRSESLRRKAQKRQNMTRELIGVSMEEINKGNQIADHVMDSLKTAVDAVDNVNGMIQKTAGNAADQAQSMEQIRVGIEEISQGVQDNSAIAEGELRNLRRTCIPGDTA